MIACFSLLPCPRDFSRKPFCIIAIQHGNLLICMVAALLQAQGRENGRQRRLNVPSVSTILLIFHQSCGGSLEHWSYCSLRGALWKLQVPEVEWGAGRGWKFGRAEKLWWKVGSGWRCDRKNLRLVAGIESQERIERDILLPVSLHALREYITRSSLLFLFKQQTLNRIHVYKAGVDQVALKWPICKLAWRIMGVLFTAPSCSRSHLPTFSGPNVLSNQGQWAGELN